VAADHAQGEEIVERQGKIAGDDERGGDCDLFDRLRLKRCHDLGEVDIAHQAVERENGDGQDQHADNRADPAPAQSVNDRLRCGARHVDFRRAQMNSPTQGRRAIRDTHVRIHL
jgi:hypothetical protein